MTKWLHGWLRSAHHLSAHTHTHMHSLSNKGLQRAQSSLPSPLMLWKPSGEAAAQLAGSLSEDRLLIVGTLQVVLDGVAVETR